MFSSATKIAAKSSDAKLRGQQSLSTRALAHTIGEPSSTSVKRKKHTLRCHPMAKKIDEIHEFRQIRVLKEYSIRARTNSRISPVTYPGGRIANTGVPSASFSETLFHSGLPITPSGTRTASARLKYCFADSLKSAPAGSRTLR